jgi:signal transduction histidine kinase
MEFDYSALCKYCKHLKSIGITDFRKHFLTCDPEEIKKCDPTIKRINDEVLRLWELSSSQKMIDLSKQKNLQIDPNMRRKARANLAEGKTTFDYEEIIWTFKGNSRNVHTRVAVSPGSEHTLSRVYLCFVDITEQKRAEQELRALQSGLRKTIYVRTNELKLANIQLRKQMQQRNEFIRALAHELKTPLTSIYSTSDYLVENIPEGPWHSAAENINRGARRLNKRIMNYLI